MTGRRLTPKSHRRDRIQHSTLRERPQAPHLSRVPKSNQRDEGEEGPTSNWHSIPNEITGGDSQMARTCERNYAITAGILEPQYLRNANEMGGLHPTYPRLGPRIGMLTSLTDQQANQADRR
ncbi:hypothetical protein KC320_g14 [Hortaea werneckii]|nr:hypothetical protein KC320_g14 [Hortaea werneckii]